MKKFYTFTAGKKVPEWMMNFVCSDVDMHTNKNSKIFFGRSVVAVRESGELTKLMPASGGDSYIEIKDMINASVGGVLGASGVEINEITQSGFGSGLTYKF